MAGFIKRIFKTAYDIFPIFNRPMAVCAAFSCGAVYYMYRHANNAFSILLLFLMITVVLCVISRNKKTAVVSVLFLAVCASAVNELMLIDDLQSLDGRSLSADFVAVEDSESSEKVTRVTAYCTGSDDIPENTKFILHYFFEKDIKCGDRFSAYVKLTNLPDDKYKPNNIGNSVYMNCRAIKFNSTYEKQPFFAAVGNVRNYIKRTVKKNYSYEDSSLLIALNTGDRSFLSDDFYGRVLNCGVSHIMVVSGLHISIIAGSVFILLEKLFYNRYFKAMLSLLLIFAICAVCGFTISVLRAGCMFVFSAVSPVFMRKNDSFNSLGSAVILLLFISPLCVLSVGFWLSVLSTVAVVWLAPFYCNLLTEKLKLKNRFAVGIVSVMVVSVTAMIFTAPVSLMVFGYVSLLSPLAFLLLTYPVTFALIFNSGGLLLSAVRGLSFLSEPLFFLADLCSKYIRFIIDNLGQISSASINADIVVFVIFVFSVFALISGMYLYKYYVKLLKRKFTEEVYARAGNNRKRIKKRA